MGLTLREPHINTHTNMDNALRVKFHDDVIKKNERKLSRNLLLNAHKTNLHPNPCSHALTHTHIVDFSLKCGPEVAGAAQFTNPPVSSQEVGGGGYNT